MDQFDRATELEEKHREAALSHRKPVPECNGRCLNCNKKVGRVFCDQDCRFDYEQRENGKQRNIKV